MQNPMDLTGADSDDDDHGIDDLLVMNDLVAGISISGPKTPKRAWPSSQTHDSKDNDRAVCMLVCINLLETDGAFLMGINNYMKEAIADAPRIRSFSCQSDLWHPQKKPVFFEVPLE